MICHCGGALSRLIDFGEPIDATNPSRGPDNIVGKSGEQAGGQVGASVTNDEPAKHLDVTDNLFFDTCAYNPWFLSAAIRQRGVKRMVFGTEAPGSGSAQLNPQTGKASDHVVAIIDKFDFLSTQQKTEIFHDNPLRVFPLVRKVREV